MRSVFILACAISVVLAACSYEDGGTTFVTVGGTECFEEERYGVCDGEGSCCTDTGCCYKGEPCTTSGGSTGVCLARGDASMCVVGCFKAADCPLEGECSTRACDAEGEEIGSCSTGDRYRGAPCATGACDGSGACVECTSSSHCSARLCNTASCTGTTCSYTAVADSTSCGSSGVCSAGACIECSTDGDCSGSRTCVDEVCVECADDSMCEGDTPVCDMATNRCEQCVTTADCPAETPICNGECVECLADSDCLDPARPLCQLGYSYPLTSFTEYLPQYQCVECDVDATCEAKITEEDLHCTRKVFGGRPDTFCRRSSGNCEAQYANNYGPCKTNSSGDFVDDFQCYYGVCTEVAPTTTTTTTSSSTTSTTTATFPTTSTGTTTGAPTTTTSGGSGFTTTTSTSSTSTSPTTASSSPSSSASGVSGSTTATSAASVSVACAYVALVGLVISLGMA